MNAIKFLLKEHDKVRRILADIADDSHRAKTKKERFDALCQDLLIHEKMEQAILYPNFEDNAKLKDIVKHLMEEEAKAESAMIPLEKNANPEEWDADFLKFKKDVEHHASEEENKLFPKVEKLFDEAELEKIGKEMQEFKNKFK